VHRERSGPDGRLSCVTLTATGHALIELSVDGLLRHEEALLAMLLPHLLQCQALKLAPRTTLFHGPRPDRLTLKSGHNGMQRAG